jgi:S-adenosylmethionine:tRNA ribosyltransferase-isomerase
MSAAALTLSDFDFALPPELIAQHPPAERSGSRLLDGTTGVPVDRAFRDLPLLMSPGDLMVFNDTRVIKARLFGMKSSGGVVEALVERILPEHEVLAHMRASKSPKAGSTVRFAEAFDAEVLGRAGPDDGLFHLRFPADPLALLDAHGHVPLPPYITHADGEDDQRRYQTVFAARPGAVAAPTASLHFDEALLAALAARGVRQARVTLHVGAGTFQPVRSENLPSTACTASGTRWAPRRWPPSPPRARRAAAWWRWARPRCARWSRPLAAAPWRPAPARPTSSSRRDIAFRVVDLLVTNFHLPRSTLLMLVSAFRPRPRDGAVPPCHRGALPLLQLRRRDAAGPPDRYRCGLRITRLRQSAHADFRTAGHRRPGAPRPPERSTTAWCRRPSSCRWAPTAPSRA